ncbi:MAG: arginase [Spirochaetales bacterium]|nr:MAG: arginase [Spirochaetales bacterium]
MKLGIIGVPQDIGSAKRGVDMGPSAIRVAGLRKVLEKLGHEVADFGNLSCFDIDQNPHYMDSKPRELNYLKPIIETCLKVKTEVEKALGQGCMPLVLGGDHSISIGTLAGMKSLHKGRTGILWVDAHADFNTPETTPSGNIHGMPLAVLTGRGSPELLAIGPSPTVSESNTVIIGLRDVDPGEARNLKNSKVSVFTMRDIEDRGIGPVMRDALSAALSGVDFLHVSFDIDSIDPFEAPGTGYNIPGGLSYREARLIMEMIYDSGRLTSLEVVEVDPARDIMNKTGAVAVELISCALGKQILL